MSTPAIPLCNHLKTNGVLCGSPALRGLDFCYFHEHWRRHHPNRNRTSQPALVLPLLEDANAVQLALQQVMQAILANQLDPRRAGLLLYALQTASANLKRVNFEPAFVLSEQHRAGDAADYPEDDEPVEDSSAAAPTAAAAAPEAAAPAEPAAPADAASAPEPKLNAPAKPPRPAPEQDAELDDDELIAAIRALAGLT